MFFHGFMDEFLKLAVTRPIIKGSWTPQEMGELNRVLSRLPPSLVSSNPKLSYIVRAKILINAPPGAPGHSMYKPSNGGTLVIFDKGIYDSKHKLDPELFAKSVLHELSHTVNRPIPGVFGKPPYITEYAGKSKKEDWAESFAEYFLHPDILNKQAPDKYRAIKTFIGEYNGR